MLRRRVPVLKLGWEVTKRCCVVFRVISALWVTAFRTRVRGSYKVFCKVEGVGAWPFFLGEVVRLAFGLFRGLKKFQGGFKFQGGRKAHT